MTSVDGLAHGVERLADQVVEQVAEQVVPRLRGRLHQATAPLALLAGAVLVVAAPTTAARWACVVFTLGAVLLFTVSATYHTGSWSEPRRLLLKRWDHANIFVLIASSYTPFAVLLLPGPAARTLLVLVWAGALLGACFQVFWVTAPRWLYVPVYVALGWAAVFWIGDFRAADQPLVLALAALGGVLYTAGAVVYGVKRPNPVPAWFGFHEVFHALTIAAFVAHWVGIWLLVG